MSIEIRPLVGSEVGEYVRVVTQCMGFTFTPDRIARSSVPEHELQLGAFDGGALAGAAGSFTFGMSVPGGISPQIGGLTHVGVLPTHRRRGILTNLVRRIFDENRRRGQCLSALFASEGAIYGRFGYGMASLAGDIELPRAGAAFVDGPRLEPKVSYVAEADGAALFAPIWDRARAVTPGMCSRSEGWWRSRRVGDPDGLRAGRPHLQRVLLELDGRAAGYALFRVTTSFERFLMHGTLDVVEAIADSPLATRALWRWLLDLDLVDTTRASLLPPDHPLFFLLVDPRQMRMTLADALWVRLVDVEGALSQRTYEGGAPLVLDVSDSFCPWNAGRYVLADGVAKRTDRAADLSLDVSALGSAYLGAFPFTQMALAGRIAEHTAGALRRADILFSTRRAPWSPEIF